MAPIGLNTANIPVKTRQIVVILLIILGCAIIAALIGYCAGTLINIYRAHRRNKARAKKISDIEASEEEGKKSIQRILSQINPPNIPPVPSPPTVYVAPGRRVKRAVMSCCSVEPFVNVSHHTGVAPTVHPACSSNQGGLAANEPVSDVVPRPCGEVHQSRFSPNARPSEKIHQGGFPINRSASAPVARPSDDNLTPRSIPIPPIVARSISAPSRSDIVRFPTITMRDRYPVIFPGSWNHGTVPASSGKPQLATAVDGEAAMDVNLQEYDVPGPSLVSNAERPGPNLHNNTGNVAFVFLTNASHIEPESMLAYNHLP